MGGWLCRGRIEEWEWAFLALNTGSYQAFLVHDRLSPLPLPSLVPTPLLVLTIKT
jgi:hypothetical protein